MQVDRTCWRIAIGASVALAGGISFDAVAQAASPVRYTQVVEHDVRRSVELPGSVESLRSSVVASEVRGLVVALDAREGDRVVKDEPLAHLRPVYYELQLRAAEGRLKEARARLKLAERKLARADELFRDEVISQNDQDDAFSEFTAWQGRVDQAEAEIASLELALDRCVIRAPFAGVVVLERTEIGQWVVEGGPVVELVAPNELEVRVEVPERYFGLVRPGVAATVTIEAEGASRVQGRVRGVIPRADPRARSFPIKVALPNPEGRVGVGMLASVSLPVGEVHPALIVPKDAVVRQSADEVVFRIKSDDTVEPVPVQSGLGFGSWIVVRGSVSAGDRVVTRGNERLFPGQTVVAELQEYPLP